MADLKITPQRKQDSDLIADFVVRHNHEIEGQENRLPPDEQWESSRAHPRQYPLLIGEFPDYEIDFHCACDWIKDDGTSVARLLPLLEKLSHEESIKQLDLIWWVEEGTRGEGKTQLSDEKLDLATFRDRSESESLSDGTLYRISTPSPH